MKKDYSYIRRMTPEQALKYYKKNEGRYSKLISKFTSLLRTLFGKVFRGRHLATASGVNVIEVRGGSDDVGGRPKKIGGRSGHSLVVDKLDLPGPRQLQKNLDALEMRDAIDQIEAIIEACSKTENERMRAEIVPMTERHSAMVDLYMEAINGMTELSKGNTPPAVNDLFFRVQKHFEEIESARIEAAQKEIDARKEAGEDVTDAQQELDDADTVGYFVNIGTKDGVTDFVFNIDITHWRDMTNGFHKALVVVVTARLAPADDKFNLTTFVNVHDRIVLPNKYEIGRPVAGKDTADIANKLINRVEREVALHEVVTFSVKADLNLDATEVQARVGAIEGITGITVENNEVLLEFPEGDREIQAQVLRAFDRFPNIAKLVKSGYARSLRSIDGNMHSYSLVLK